MRVPEQVEAALETLRPELATCCLTCGDVCIGGYTELGDLPFKVCRSCIWEGAIAVGLIDRDDYD